MGKIALLFPGQGSQYVGMAHDLIRIYPEANSLLKQADEVLGYKLSEMILFGPEEKLKMTANTQPALLAVSIICWRLLERNLAKPSYAAGHSLGEYSALVAAKSLDFLDAIQLVHRRGKLMEKAVPGGKGAMAAILGLPFESVEEFCKASSYKVETVNYNCPGQAVIAGEAQGVRQVSTLATQNGAKKVVPLNVSGPFHSSLMRSVADEFANYLETVSFRQPDFPIVTNVLAEIEDDKVTIRNCLKEQIYSPVLWQASMEKLIDQGVDLFIEVGPSKILAALMKKINKNAKVLNVENLETLHIALEVIKGGKKVANR